MDEDAALFMRLHVVQQLRCRLEAPLHMWDVQHTAILLLPFCKARHTLGSQPLWVCQLPTNWGSTCPPGYDQRRLEKSNTASCVSETREPALPPNRTRLLPMLNRLWYARPVGTLPPLGVSSFTVSLHAVNGKELHN